MPTVRQRIEALDDYEVVRFLEHFGQQLFQGMTVSVDQVRAGIPDEVQKIPEFGRIATMSESEAARALAPADSVALARTTLLGLAEDETFGPLLERALDSYRDQEMFADVILSAGFVASMLLMTATVEFEGSAFGIKFRKRKADADLVKAITEPLANALSRRPGE